MAGENFERRLVGEVALDICYPCRAIWFDHLESAQLSPGGVIRLFKLIHEHRNDERRLLSERLGCPICAEPLGLVNDIQRSGRFTYYRCPAAHGRLTSFFQFLREKEFVRSLTAAEIATLRAKVTQVRCSSCGGPVDLQRDPVCPYCHSPISILDGDAVEKALADLEAKEHQRTAVDPTALTHAMLDTQIQRIRMQQLESRAYGPGRVDALPGAGDAIDLVTACISHLSDLFD
jgi:Zn finger protein HypA/HybF involved in hydrogenase expression